MCVGVWGDSWKSGGKFSRKWVGGGQTSRRESNDIAIWTVTFQGWNIWSNLVENTDLTDVTQPKGLVQPDFQGPTTRCRDTDLGGYMDLRVGWDWSTFMGIRDREMCNGTIGYMRINYFRFFEPRIILKFYFKFWYFWTGHRKLIFLQFIMSTTVCGQIRYVQETSDVFATTLLLYGRKKQEYIA